LPSIFILRIGIIKHVSLLYFVGQITILPNQPHFYSPPIQRVISIRERTVKNGCGNGKLQDEIKVLLSLLSGSVESVCEANRELTRTRRSLNYSIVRVTTSHQSSILCSYIRYWHNVGRVSV